MSKINHLEDPLSVYPAYDNSSRKTSHREMKPPQINHLYTGRVQSCGQIQQVHALNQIGQSSEAQGPTHQ